MHDRGEQRRRRAKPRHRVGRHRFEPARGHRIGRPHKGRDERRDQAGHLAGGDAAGVACEQEHRAGQSEHSANNVMRRQPFAGQQRGEQHDQKRPQIIQQAGFGGRRKAQRQEIQCVIAEQAADADDPCDQRLTQCVDSLTPPDPCQRSHQRADRKRHRRELECGNLSGRNRHHRQQRPHQDRGQPDQADLGPDPVGDFYQGGAFCSMEFDGDASRIIDWK